MKSTTRMKIDKKIFNELKVINDKWDGYIKSMYLSLKDYRDKAVAYGSLVTTIYIYTFLISHESLSIEGVRSFFKGEGFFDFFTLIILGYLFVVLIESILQIVSRLAFYANRRISETKKVVDRAKMLGTIVRMLNFVLYLGIFFYAGYLGFIAK